MPEDRNMWGTLKADVDTASGYCAECERENGRHYGSCPLYVRPAIQCECGAYWCHRDHDAESALAAQTPAV